MTKAPDVRVRPRRWRVRVVVALLVVSSVAVAVYHLVIDRGARRSIAEATELLDASDPGWRLEDIEAARTAVPDHENAAPLVAAFRARAEGKDVSVLSVCLRRLKKVRPCERLPEMERGVMEMALGELEEAMRASIDLAARPRGRHPSRWERSLRKTPHADLDASLETCEFWCLLSATLAERGELRPALWATRAALNAGRSIGDEPLAVSQTLRASCAMMAATMIERALAQGAPPSADLAALQRLAEDEDRHPGFLIAMRGERARAHAEYERLFRGELTYAELRDAPERKWLSPPAWWEVHKLRREYTRYLTYSTRLVEVARGATEGGFAAEQAFLNELRGLPDPAQLLFDLLLRADTGSWFRRKQSSMRCLATMLAIERYRQAEGKWPDGLDQLVPAYLPAVPTGPFDGKPLRLRAREDGVTIYSVGQDMTDHGGDLLDWDIETRQVPGDLGYRLYNPDRRRQPPADKEPDDDERP